MGNESLESLFQKNKFLPGLPGRKPNPPVSHGLPTEPVNVKIEPWWVAQVGNIQEEDVKARDGVDSLL